MASQIPTHTREAIEAAAFRRLVKHFQERTDVQNLDVMNLAGFCRNCLSKWYRQAAVEHGLEMSDPEAREAIYGMPYEQWKVKYQTEVPLKPADPTPSEPTPTEPKPTAQ